MSERPTDSVPVPVPVPVPVRASPRVSVVIASVNGLPAIEKCLRALVAQAGGGALEVVVADRCGGATREAIRAFPAEVVRLVEAEGRPSIPRLRALGMARARGETVVILEDHCNVAPGWLVALERARAAGWQAIGGAVENGSPERLIDRAVFFCEYARFMPPLERGPAAEITGNNSAYDRRLLERLGARLEEEVWEGFLHERLAELGAGFYCEPEMLVYHEKEFGFGYFLSQRYHYSRSFAGMRLAGAPGWKRWGYALATAALPPLLAWRLARTVWAKGRRASFLAALPVLVPFLLVWAWGEAVGAVAGPGGSLARVE